MAGSVDSCIRLLIALLKVWAAPPMMTNAVACAYGRKAAMASSESKSWM
jgi:hypothetical protein